LPTLAAQPQWHFRWERPCLHRIGVACSGDSLPDMQSDHRARLRRIVAERLESLYQAGVLQLPKSQGAAADRKATEEQSQNRGSARPSTALRENQPEATGESSGAVSAASSIASQPTLAKKSGWQPARPTSLFEAASATVQGAAPALSLEVIQQQVAGCTRCSELASTRTQTVFGVGNPNARLCFLGEAPGADEDRTGIPFVGRGGQLLTKIIEACRMKREDVYILNMLKCRPPGNRNPLPQELTNCRGYLESQLDLIRPEFICCLGAVAAQNLLGTNVSIGKLRGKVHQFRGAKVVCTYHPAFLLRSPAFKKETWEDMKLLMREMGVEL
jgi:uracil-DNA glycosylase